MFWTISSLNLLGVGARTERGEFAGLREGERFGARDFDALEGVVRFRLLLHLGFDLREVVGRDAVRQFDVVVEAVLDRRTGGELRFRPDLEDGRGQDVRGGMAQPLDVGHLRALLESFAFVAHESGKKVAVLRRFTSDGAPRRPPECSRRSVMFALKDCHGIPRLRSG